MSKGKLSCLHWLTVLTALCVLLACCACTPTAEVQPFSVQAGQAAWVEVPSPVMLTAEARRVTLPQGLLFVADWGDMGIEVAQLQSDDSLMYGLMRDGVSVLPCVYTAVQRVGNYLFTQRFADDKVYMDVRNRAGEVLAGINDLTAKVYALGDYFVLYTDANAQLFDAQGNPCFTEGVLSPQDGVSICGDYVLTADTVGNVYCVWQLYASQRGVSAFLRHRFYDADMRYNVSYVGTRFLVTAISEATPQDYTYIEVQDGVSHYMRQQAWWYDAAKDALSPTQLDHVLLSVKNACTPGIHHDDVAAMHLADGYSAAVVAECNDYKVHEEDRYYIMDSRGRLMVRYPAGINPTAFIYRDGYGFVGSAAEGGAALLYDTAGNLLWQRKDHAYATMRWQGGRFVASYVGENGVRYGAFDDQGNIAIPFEYDYMSPFVQGRCVARLGDEYYVLNDAGAMVAVADVAGNEQWLAYGLYVRREGDLYGISNLAGQTLVPAQWAAIESVGIAGDGYTYVVARQADGSRTQIILQ